MRCLHELHNEKVPFWGYLLTIQNACPTVKEFHRMNLKQNKRLNSKYDSEIGKTNKNWPQTGLVVYDRISFFWKANKNFRVAGKN